MANNQTEKGKGKGNNNPVTAQTAQKETNMKVQNEGAKRILGMLKETKNETVELVRPHEKAILEKIAVTPLKDIMNGATMEFEWNGTVIEEPVPILSLIGNLISLRTISTHKNEKGETVTTKTTKGHAIWNKDQLATVLERAEHNVFCLRKEEAKNAGILGSNDKAWIYPTEENIERYGDFAYRLSDGSLKEEPAYVIPSIGAFNYKTGKVENVPTEPIIVNLNELHHGIRRFQTPTYAAVNKKNKKANHEPNTVKWARELKAAEKAGDDKRANTLKKLIAFANTTPSTEK